MHEGYTLSRAAPTPPRRSPRHHGRAVSRGDSARDATGSRAESDRPPMLRIPDSCCGTRPRQPAFASCTAGRPSIRRSRQSSRTSRRLERRCPSPTSTATDGPISTSRTAASASPTRSIATAATARSRTSPRARDSRISIAQGEGVSMGAVWGDFDNDGREDVLVYRYGYPALFRNVDGRRFEDVTAQCRPAPLGEQQRRDLARLRSRRPARSLHHRVFPRRRSVASRDDEDHAQQLRVRDQRREESALSQCSAAASSRM